MIFGRTPQVRVGGAVKTSPIDFEFAGALTRPPQRDSGIPGMEWGVRLEFNKWRAPHGRGSGQPTLDGLQLGVSGVLRKFKVIAFSNNRGDITQATDVAEAGGKGLSFDALVPLYLHLMGAQPKAESGVRIDARAWLAGQPASTSLVAASPGGLP